MKPLNDNVFLIYNEKKQPEKGIVYSDVSKNQQATAKVVAIGDEVTKVKVNDIVIFDPFVPREVKLDGQKYLIIKEKYIYAIK